VGGAPGARLELRGLKKSWRCCWVVEPLVVSDTSPISVYLVVGVNGVSKATSILQAGEPAQAHKHRVLLAAGDLSRAAARTIKTWGNGSAPGDQPSVWRRSRCGRLRRHKRHRRARGVLIVGTAGRLHANSISWKAEKVMRVLQKYDDEAPPGLAIDRRHHRPERLSAGKTSSCRMRASVGSSSPSWTGQRGSIFAVASSWDCQSSSSGPLKVSRISRPSHAVPSWMRCSKGMTSLCAC
jgi:hypothetical protein